MSNRNKKLLMELQTSDYKLRNSAPAALYQGVDTVRGIGLSTAVGGNQSVNSGYSKVTYRITTDATSLYESLGISQWLAVGFGLFGSVNEKVNFVRELNLSTYSVCIVVHASHVQGITTTTDFSLLPNHQAPKTNQEMQEFFLAYGDSFVSSLTRGSEYYAVYTYYAQTRSESEAITAELKANGFYMMGSLNAGFQSNLDKVTKNTKVKITFSQNITGIANPKLPSPDKLVQYAIDFPSIPIGSGAAILSYKTTGYERVRNFGNFKPVSSNRNFLIGENDKGGLAESLVKFELLFNEIKLIKQIYETYQGFTDTKLNDVQAQAKKDINAINAQFRMYADNSTATLTAPALPSLQHGTPALSYEIRDSPLYGGGYNGGWPFNDVDVNSFLQKQTRLSAIQMRSAGYVDALILTYVNNSDGTKLVQYGGDGGILSHKLQLMPDQVVTNLSGRAEGYVDRLSITITRGGNITGGGDGGKQFTMPIPAGSVFIGFRGRSGGYIDQIGGIFVKLKPATWHK